MLGMLGVPISATRELLNNSDRRCTKSMNALEALCACSTVSYTNTQFIVVIKRVN